MYCVRTVPVNGRREKYRPAILSPGRTVFGSRVVRGTLGRHVYRSCRPRASDRRKNRKTIDRCVPRHRANRCPMTFTVHGGRSSHSQRRRRRPAYASRSTSDAGNPTGVATWPGTWCGGLVSRGRGRVSRAHGRSDYEQLSTVGERAGEVFAGRGIYGGTSRAFQTHIRDGIVVGVAGTVNER